MRAIVRSLLAALIALPAGADALADDARQVSYGRHLARECTACHRLEGPANGIPSLAGWSRESFATTLRFYQTGARTNPAMVSVAQSLDAAQVEALAAYFASLPKPGQPSASTPRK